MQTAIDWLMDQYKKDDGKFLTGVYEQAKEKEKEQIMDSYLQGSFDDGPNITNSEQYYNQTYNQTNVGNDGFEFDNSSTIPPPKTNKPMNKEFIPYEQALELKELGFDEECFKYYTEMGTLRIKDERPLPPLT